MAYSASDFVDAVCEQLGAPDMNGDTEALGRWCCEAIVALQKPAIVGEPTAHISWSNCSDWHKVRADLLKLFEKKHSSIGGNYLEIKAPTDLLKQLRERYDVNYCGVFPGSTIADIRLSDRQVQS